jgi:formyltetrahydrofolate deformylase
LETGVLLVSCPDARGIVAAIAQLLYGAGANILDADQHTDLEAGMFFQRIRFELEGLPARSETLRSAITTLAQRFAMDWRLVLQPRTQRVAIFVSRVDHCFYDLVLRQRSGELGCEIAAVVSNHRLLEPAARQFDLPFFYTPIAAATSAPESAPKSAEKRCEQEAKQLELLAELGVELVVLARYMQILSAEMVQRYRARILNIHHSFLPAFVGSNPYRRAYQRGVKLIGATAHYVTTDLDEGPIVEQDVVRCSHRDALADLIRKGRDLERVVLARAVRCHLEDRVLVYGNKTVVFD